MSSKKNKNIISYVKNDSMIFDVDKSFNALIVFIKERNLQEIKDAISQNLNYLKSKNLKLYNIIIDYYNKYKLWGTYYPEKGNIDLVNNRAQAFFEHIDDFIWIYNNLYDYRSKKLLVNILYFWLMSDPSRINSIIDKYFYQYFDLDIIKCNKNEVFVDIGAFIGDTINDYLKVWGNNCYSKIYSYEIVPKNIECMQKFVKSNKLKNIDIRGKGASNKNGKMYISSNETITTIQLEGKGSIEVPIVKIDDDIKKDVTFIKMDIEGGEEKALLGCVKKIKKNHPKLALSVYHNHKDIWKLARIIYDIDPSYKFYLRYYGGNFVPTEYILYAV